jgi:hypothetical protein
MHVLHLLHLLGFTCGTHRLLVDMCLISFIVSCSLVGSSVVDISTAPISENGNLTRVSYKEENKWIRNAYQKCNRGKTVDIMKTCEYNTGYYEWLCVRMTLRIMQ